MKRGVAAIGTPNGPRPADGLESESSSARSTAHEWAFIKTRWTPKGNGVKVLRCMHCRCEKHVRYNGTKGGGEYIVPGGTLTKAMPSCAK